MSERPKILAEAAHGGQMLRLWLDAPPGNVLDIEMMRGLLDTLRAARAQRSLKGIVFAGRGKHFSYGASVPEHAPERVAEMLACFHALVRAVLNAEVPTLAAVRGACLGGGLELASCCTVVFCSPEAQLGQPEIRLGVFAPAASVLLPGRIGGGRALELCVSGRSVGAEEALRLGLVHAIAADPVEAAESYFAEHLAPRSASSLRHATRAVQLGSLPAIEAQLAVLETRYLEELMSTEDAVEGIAAFLEKRPPRWKDR